MLAEFKYGGIPKESFAWVPFVGSQDVPRQAFYYLKKDFFPWVYFKYFVKVGLNPPIVIYLALEAETTLFRVNGSVQEAGFAPLATSSLTKLAQVRVYAHLLYYNIKKHLATNLSVPSEKAVGSYLEFNAWHCNFLFPTPSMASP